MDRHIYIVTLELKATWVRNYKPLYSVLQSFPFWMHYLDDTWFIVSDVNAQEIYNRLAPFVFVDCHVIITRMNRDYFGYLPQDAWDWINQHNALL